METHICRWKSLTEWRDEPANTIWKVIIHYRLQRCSDCGMERNLSVLGQRRRQRNALVDHSDVPSDLRAVAAGQRWRSIAEALAELNTTRAELEPQIAEWLRSGWIEVEETQDRHSHAWDIVKFRLSSSAVDVFIRQPRLERQQANDMNRLDALATLSGWQADFEQAYTAHLDDDEILDLLKRLSAILTQQEIALQNGTWTPLPDTTFRLGDLPHQRWLYVLRGIVAVLASTRWEYERAFSARWLGSSKALIADRKDIETYLHLPLEKLGLFKHSPMMYCWGPFMASLEGHLLDGQAGLPFVAYSADTVQGINFITLTASAILVIENQTAFEFMLRSSLRKPEWLYLFGGGHAGYTERKFILKCLEFAPKLPWYIWTDWDYGGVRIQTDWAKWAGANDVSTPQPLWWDSEQIARWSFCGKPLSNEERVKLLDVDQHLAQILVQSGITIEQEAMLHEIGENELRCIIDIQHLSG